MSMKTSTRQVDGVTIVDCSGRITLGEGSVILKDVVRELLSKGQKKILLNLGDVPYVDSAGLGEIVPENLFENIHADPRWLPFLRKVGKAPASRNAWCETYFVTATVSSTGCTSVGEFEITRRISLIAVC